MHPNTTPSDLRGKSRQTLKHNPIGLLIGTLVVLGMLAIVGDYMWKTWPNPQPRSVVADARLPST